MLLTTLAVRWPTLVKAAARGRGAMVRVGAAHGTEGGGTNPGASGTVLVQTSSLVWGLGTKIPYAQGGRRGGEKAERSIDGDGAWEQACWKEVGNAGGEQAVGAGVGQNGCGRVGRDRAHGCKEGRAGEIRHCPSSHAKEVRHGTSGSSCEQRLGEPTERRD